MRYAVLMLTALRSPDPAVRETALRELVDSSLAAEVARMIDDVHPAVQLQAMHAFQRLGAGSVDSVPVLIAFRSRVDASATLRTRATLLLGVVGKCAEAAVPALIAELPNFDALTALLQIVPEDVRVMNAVGQAAFSSDYALSTIARDAVATASPALLDVLMAEVFRRPEEFTAIHIALASHRPEALTPFIVKALSKSLRPAIAAAGKLPEPLPAEIIGLLVGLARKNETAAVEVLASRESLRSEMQPLFLEVIRNNVDATPVSGPAGEAARALAVAACVVDERGLSLLENWLAHARTQLTPKASMSTFTKVNNAVTALAARAHGAASALAVPGTAKSSRE